MHARALLRALFALLFPPFAASPPAAAGPYTDPGHLPLEMVAWASSVVALERGPIDAANPAAGTASFGVPQDALGEASANSLDVLSLGDGGSITLYFEAPIHNGPGDDLAVYENGFATIGGLFAELAFVEVASNGSDFAAFAATALPGTPVASFDTLDPTDYHGLAGRHPIGTGTGFDLGELAGDSLVEEGLVDLQQIHYVRITDVVGDGSRIDSAARPIFDPYPTAFAAGGFDLEAVGARFVPEPALALGLLAGVALVASLFRSGRRRALPVSLTVAASSLLVAVGLPSRADALTATFDDLGLAANAYLNGATLAGGFESGGVFFENQYDSSFDVFSGFAASTTTDTTTPGFGNQFSNITGAGAGGSAGFGIGFFDGRIALPSSQTVLGAWFTNTTYAALAMRDGDFFSKRFGGPTGTDPDYFRLVIEGFDDQGGSTGTASLLLADFRSADSAADYILDEWVFLDLSGLGAVRALRFGFESSDVGAFGINTPTYFAIDELSTIPEPGVALLLGLGLGVLARRPSGLR
ncbi:MAG: DUF4465 domain-containing protein [Deltaproteobacteria bacterium]|nr:DUF4465 domain-containing protein [Deltaproteobacteria bacterium]